MIRPIEDWQQQFLELQKLRLGAGLLIGFLKRWIKQRIREASPEELFRTEKDLWQWAVKLIKSEGKRSISTGKLRIEWTGHPLYKLLFDESIRREKELEALDPRSYFGPIYDLTTEEWRDFMDWRSTKHRGAVDKTTEEFLSMWRKDKKRSLPVIPSNLVGDGKETKTDNRLISSSGVKSQNGRPIRESSLQGSKTPTQESRAYGPRKKI